MANYNITFSTASSYDITANNSIVGFNLNVTDFGDVANTIIWEPVVNATVARSPIDFGFTGGAMYELDLNLRRPNAGQLYPR